MSLEEYIGLLGWIIVVVLSGLQLIYGLRNFFSKSGYIPSLIIHIRVMLISKFFGDDKGKQYLEHTIETRSQKYWGANYIFVGGILMIYAFSRIMTILK